MMAKTMLPPNQSADGTPLSPIEQLNAILFQFVNLYERWSEDRQVAAKQGLAAAQLMEAFAEEVENFAELEESVREALLESLVVASQQAASNFAQLMAEAANREVMEAARKLKETVRYTEMAIESFKNSALLSHWKIIIVSFVTTIATALLIVRWLIPTPVLPLTSQQVQWLDKGRALDMVMYRMSDDEKKRLKELVGDSFG